jgi:hypothetical protein
MIVAPNSKPPRTFNAQVAESFVVGRGRHCDLPTQAASREILRQGSGELHQRPVDLVASDHQRRRDPDRVLMGILGEDALAKSTTALVTAEPMSELPNDRQTPIAVSTGTNSADEYNWSGFSCPYCDAPGFVSCAGGHLAYDGTIQVRKGGRFHQCFCGHAAFIVGTIKTFENERLSVGSETPNAPPGDAQRQPKWAN